MSINGIKNTESVQTILTSENLTSNEKTREELSTNIAEKLNEKGFVSFFKNLFNPNRKVALTSLQYGLEHQEKKLINADMAYFSKYLPQSTKKLFMAYLTSFPKEENTTISQEKFNEMWQGLQDTSGKLNGKYKLGEGGFGSVYQSQDGKYVIKVPKYSDDDTDITGNESLQKGIGSFDKREVYYSQNAGFITKYGGAFDVQINQNGLKVTTKATVFEKIDGKDFSDCYTIDPKTQFRLFAQAATAIAISHEAGCSNPDIKPANMMVTNVKTANINKENVILSTEKSNLKLIDQGCVVDFTKLNSAVSGFTPGYAAPEVKIRKTAISPAADVFALGVSLLDKLSANAKDQSLLQNIIDVFALKTGGMLLEGTIQKELKESLAKNKSDEEKQAIINDFITKYSPEENNGYVDNVVKSLQDYNIVGNKEENAFVGSLLADCLKYNPEDRISAAQAGEILQVFSSYLEAKEEAIKANVDLPACPEYYHTKANAMQDCPKGIPIALREMLFKPETRENGIQCINRLVDADPSYKNTPTYGLCLFFQGNDNAFNSWAKGNEESVQWLKERTYIQGNIPQANQDMPVSKKIYKKIQQFK